MVAVFTPGSADTADSVPAHIAVATKPATQYDGSFVAANVRVRESISNATRTAAGLRARTVHKLKPGRYYVKVSTHRHRARLHAEVPVQGAVVERAARRHPAAA